MPRSHVELSGLGYRVLDYLDEHDSVRHAPTIQEISDDIDKSKFDIKSRLVQLEKLGLIEINPTTSTVALVNNSEKNSGLVAQLPYVGSLGKNTRFQLERGISSYVEIPTGLLHATRKEKLIALKVQDNSMLDMMISEDDFLIIEEVSKVNNGTLS